LVSDIEGVQHPVKDNSEELLGRDLQKVVREVEGRVEVVGE
jgi:hypothetical protein